MKLAAGVKPDYIWENKQPRTNLTLLSLDAVECLTTHPSSNSDKIISNLSVTPLLRLIHLLDLLKAFSLCGVVPWTIVISNFPRSHLMAPTTLLDSEG